VQFAFLVRGEAPRGLCLHALVNGEVTRLHGCDVNELSIKKNETFVLKLPCVYISKHSDAAT
jgi:hypothetical protein